MSRKTFDDWREAKEYLPDWMRDFHDQKELFKKLLRTDPPKDLSFNYLEGLNPVNTHIFVVDYFLWILAAHGYTLQKTKRKDDYNDIHAYLRKAYDERIERESKVLQEILSPKVKTETPSHD